MNDSLMSFDPIVNIVSDGLLSFMLIGLMT
jgi:hypothetical protein